MKSIPKSALVLFILGGLFALGGLSFIAAGEWANVAGGIVIAAVLCFFGFRKQKQYADQLARAREEEAAKLAKAQAEAEERAAQEAKRREYDAKHGKFQFSVAGVTFDNDDGTDRQKILKAVYRENEGSGTEASLEQYEYKGSPAIHVFIEGKCIGNIHKGDLSSLLPVMDRIEFVAAYVEPFDGEEGGKVYRCDLTIEYAK